MRTTLLFALALPAMATAATPTYRPYMTGVQLVRDVQAEPGKGSNSIRRERAMGYIEGVADASAGLSWCPAGKPLPHELPYIVAEEVAKMTGQQGGAASLVLSALGKLYPCRAGGAR